MSWRQWLVLLSLYIVYLLFGGFVFMLIESPEDDTRLQETSDLKQLIYEKLITCDDSKINNSLNDREELWIQIADKISQPHLILNGSETPKKWTIYNSFFVAVTVASTIGYGHLAPSSAAGRLFCIAFALIGIPLNGILFASLGDCFSNKFLPKSRKKSLRRFSAIPQLFLNVGLFFVPGVVIFLVFPAGIFTIVEDWAYVDSFYYAFVSLTTIGFGDLVAGQNDIGPWTWVYRTFILLWIIFGLGYLVMVINIITKGFRSKPIVAIEKKMSARIRATRKSLAKDANALRDLVNQIKNIKKKTAPKSEEIEDLSSYNQPTSHETYFSEDILQELHDNKGNVTFRRFGSKRLGNDNPTFCIESEAVLNSVSVSCMSDKKAFNEDPVELLTRLARVLCDDDDEERNSESSSDSKKAKETKNLRIGLHPESIIERIRRSFRLPDKAPIVQASFSTPSSPTPGVTLTTKGRRFPVNSYVKPQSKNDKVFDNVNNKDQLAVAIEPRKNSMENVISAQSCQFENANQTAVSIPTIVEFCDILELAKTSRRNSAEMS